MVQQLHIKEYKQKPNFMRKHSLELNLFALSLFFHFFFFFDKHIPLSMTQNGCNWNKNFRHI